MKNILVSVFSRVRFQNLALNHCRSIMDSEINCKLADGSKLSGADDTLEVRDRSRQA